MQFFPKSGLPVQTKSFVQKQAMEENTADGEKNPPAYRVCPTWIFAERRNLEVA
jgi:hypothetical protein